MKLRLLSLILLVCNACSHPQPGPDKTVMGAVLGAGWGAGAGAVVGNQVDTSTGAAVGAGAALGAAGGILTGIGMDDTEDSLIKERDQLASLKVQNMANGRQIQKLQSQIDRAISSAAPGGMYQVFFDPDMTNLRSGAIANLEAIADSLKTNPAAYVINVDGHSDDAGTPDYNQRLSEARARSVASYLGARGLSMDQILVKSYGSTRPIASNTTQTGRQLNRRVDIYIGSR